MPAIEYVRIINKDLQLKKWLVPVESVFDFSNEVVPLIRKEIASAEKYVRIAMFQIHREDVFNSLEKLLANKVKVEILTLPYDSINADVKPQVVSRFEDLIRKGAIIHFDRWNVGDPRETRTAFGRWYSFHGKFIVTDKSAIALSANFTHGEELDAVLIFRGIKDKITEFNQKFDDLLQLFILKANHYDGSIRRRVTEVVPTKAEHLFELPENVDAVHEDHWILHYPIELCPSNVSIEDKLYLTPFDCRGRDVISRIIADADKYVYISTESFTDEEFSKFLVNLTINKDVEMKILSGTKSRDFTDRIEKMFRNLLTQKIEVKTTEEAIHAKLVITDKTLVVSSINLNKMNLGHYKTKKFWRENTESLLICQDPEMIEFAKNKYLEIFDKSVNIREMLCQKLENQVGDIFKGAFQLSPNPEVRALFARFILKREIETKKIIIKVGRMTKKLMDYYKRTRIEREDFISALVLYNLSEAKKDYTQLKERINEIDEDVNLKNILSKLTFANLIEKEDEYFKINIDALAMNQTL